MQIRNNSFPRTKRRTEQRNKGTKFQHHLHEVHLAGTLDWSDPVSHITGSFVGHSPSDMLCPPAAKNRTSFTSFEKVHTHTHTHMGKWNRDSSEHIDKKQQVLDDAWFWCLFQDWNIRPSIQMSKSTLISALPATVWKKITSWFWRL